MSYKSTTGCRKFSLILGFMLFFQASFAQNKFSEADDWIKNNLNDLGGRAVLILVKNGKIIYEKAESDLSRKQKIVGKFIAKDKAAMQIKCCRIIQAHQKRILQAVANG